MDADNPGVSVIKKWEDDRLHCHDQERRPEAQLRWFGVEMSAQGKGIGTRLLTTAMQFCEEKGYTDVALWTIDILKPARHLYGRFGFQMTETKPNYEWSDHELIEEKWEYHSAALK